MALFSRYKNPAGNGLRSKGFPRYLELLECNLKGYLGVNLLTLVGFLPFGAGVLYSILTSSILILIPSCIIGGMIAGPALACTYDMIFRTLRDAPGKTLANYKHAWKQNWKAALIPGIIFCLLLGFYIFMGVMFWWLTPAPGYGTIALYCTGLILLTMFFSIYWPQLALFEQTGMQRFKNCILFCIRFFWKTLGCALIQILYWIFMVLFLPWTVFLLPLTGLWFSLFSVNFLLYDTLNTVFGIEEMIARAFPQQVPFYEDDEAWLKRKQQERE